MNPQKVKKQVVQAKSYISDSFDYSLEFQVVKTHDLREYREFDRSLTPKIGVNNDHLFHFEKWISRTNNYYLM